MKQCHWCNDFAVKKMPIYEFFLQNFNIQFNNSVCWTAENVPNYEFYVLGQIDVCIFISRLGIQIVIHYTSTNKNYIFQTGRKSHKPEGCIAA